MRPGIRSAAAALILLSWTGVAAHLDIRLGFVDRLLVAAPRAVSAAAAVVAVRVLEQRRPAEGRHRPPASGLRARRRALAANVPSCFAKAWARPSSFG